MSSVPEQWARIEVWLEAHRPDLLALLNPPASDAELRLLAEDGVPEGWLGLYGIHNGGAPVFMDWDWVPIDPDDPHTESVQSEWERMAELVGHMSGEAPPRVVGPVRAVWASERWLPIAIDYSGCSLCIDLDPAEGGQVGQLIEVEENRRRVLHPDPVSFLRWLADGLTSGEVALAEPEARDTAPPAPMLADPLVAPPVESEAPPPPPREPAPLAADVAVDLAEGPVDRTRELRIEGPDLRALVALTPEEAAAGLTVDIAGPEGPVTVALPAGAGHGARLRLPGLGLGGRGDLHLEVAVELPEDWAPSPEGRCEVLRFERWDVVVEVDLTAAERGGATVPVATHADVVRVAVPPGATVVRAEGLGLPTPRGARGDLVVVVG